MAFFDMSTNHREVTNTLKREGKGRGKAPADDTDKENFHLIAHSSIPYVRKRDRKGRIDTSTKTPAITTGKAKYQDVSIL